jgi:hypothetical protein
MRRKFKLAIILAILIGFFLLFCVGDSARAASFGGGGPTCYGAKCDPGSTDITPIDHAPLHNTTTPTTTTCCGTKPITIIINED